MPAALHLGRYTVHAELASGGMASVYLGRLHGSGGFRRLVAIKRLHPQFAKDREFVEMFLDEARLAARIHHPNVVPTLDVVAADGEIFLVLEFVRGESLAALARALRDSGEKMPVDVAATIAIGALQGLDAAHEAVDEQGAPLHLVHRDVSPQNVMVGEDGVVRVLDFGVAKASARASSTRDGTLKGKLAYMAPEQIDGETTRASDVYALGVVFWEMLTGRRLRVADTDAQMLALVRRGDVDPPSAFHLDVTPALDRVCLRALAREPSARYATAGEMLRDLDASAPALSSHRIVAWMQHVTPATIAARAKLLAAVESDAAPTVIEMMERFEALRAAGTPREAATQMIATVSSVARVAEKGVRDAASKVTALTNAALRPEAASRLRSVFSPLMRARAGATKDAEATDADKTPTEPTAEDPTRVTTPVRTPREGGHG